MRQYSKAIAALVFWLASVLVVVLEHGNLTTTLPGLAGVIAVLRVENKPKIPRESPTRTPF